MIFPVFNNYAQNRFQVNKNNLDEEKIFKRWVSDTLIKIKKDKFFLISQLPKNHINLSKDSLGLELKHDYRVQIDLKKSKFKYVNSVIDLLKDYNEAPPKGSTLKFVVSTYYYPSTIGKKYDFVFELKNLVLITPHSDITYNYIRGQLSGSSEKITRGIEKGKEFKYEFNGYHRHFKKILVEN
jgi:hypothetical protein